MAAAKEKPAKEVKLKRVPRIPAATLEAAFDAIAQLSAWDVMRKLINRGDIYGAKLVLKDALEMRDR